MKKITLSLLLSIATLSLFAQATNRIMNIFPKGTLLYDDLPYANDTLKKHLLDIYLPPQHKDKYPVVIWIHGGAGCRTINMLTWVI